jgi:hypothetical protein
MEPIISKEELNELINIKGEMRGITIKPGLSFILKEEGEEGLKKLEDAMAILGHPLKYKGIRSMDLYPIKLVAISLLAMKRLFNYDDKKFQEIGRFSAKIPFLIRVFIRGHFLSLKRVIKETPKMWRKHFTVGNLKVEKLDEEKRYAILKLENFVLHPIYCKVLEGFLPTMSKMIVKGSTIVCEETKCVHRGDECHEFLIKW